MSTTLTWSNPAGGDFNTAGNWTPVQVPGTADTVVFQVGTLTSGNYFPYVYTITGNATVATIIDQGDDVTFTGAVTSTATSSDAIGLAVSEGTLTIAAGAAFTVGPTSGSLFIVGYNATVSGGTGAIYADAQLTIAGSFTAPNLEVGEGIGNNFAATLLVTGSAARLDTTFGGGTPLGFSIGHEGTLEIENGATVQSAGGDVGSLQYGGATALLTGSGSQWNVGADTLFVGYDDGNDLTPSVLTVSNGASLTSTGGSFLFGQYGTLALDDGAVIAGVIELDGGTIAALAAAGQNGPQTITLGNTISIDVSADSTLLPGASVGFDLTGKLAGGGTLTIGPGGTVEIAGAQSGFTGSVVIDDAVLRLDAATALGSGPITFETVAGDVLNDAGTLLLAGGQTITNALSLAGGIGVLQIGHGDTFTLDNSVAGAGTLALAGGTFVITDPATEIPTGGLVLQSATVVMDVGSAIPDTPISFAGLGGSTLIWDTTTAPKISSAGTPTIAMFAGDTIAFPDLTITNFATESGGTIALLDGSTTISTFVLTGATADLQLVAFSYGGSTGSALVADAGWDNPGGGAFGTVSNWQNGVVPGSTEIAFIGQGVTTPYTITGGGTVAAMQVAFDPVTLTGSYDLLGSPSSDPGFTPLQVAQGADLSIASDGTVTAPGVLVGPGIATLDVQGTLTAATAEVEQGASLLIDGGQVSLTGTGGLYIGGGGSNELPAAALVISNGGSLTDFGTVLSLAAAGPASVLVTGPTSTWASTGTVYFGNDVSALPSLTLTVQDGATASATDFNLVENGTLDLSPTAHLVGPITTGFGVTGLVNRIAAVADPGQSGSATTTLANAITLDAGDLTLAGGAGTTLDVTGSLSGASYLDVVGDVILANGASSFSASEGLGAAELPFAIGGEAHLGTAGQSGTLEEAATGAFGTNTVSFASGSNNTLIVDAGVTATNTLSGFALGDTIDLRGLAFAPGAAVGVNGSTVTVTSGAASVTLDMVGIEPGATLIAASDGIGATPGTDLAVLCFLAGTLIRTPRGERPVEQLAVGDDVLTWGGAVQPIDWIGEGRVLATRGRRTAATPVIVRRGAFADNCPTADLRVTKGHAFLIDGALVPAEYLVNHRSIVWDDHAQEVRLYHLELPRHDVLVANGAPAESYRDDGNRWLFANADSVRAGPEKPVYAPVLTGGALVDAAWRRLLLRAGGGRLLPLTDDADLHLLADGSRADGRRIDGARAADGCWTFRLPAVPAVLRIVSRFGAPDQLGLARDPRELGVALRAVTLHQGARQGAIRRRIVAADVRLADGFHAYEADGGFRWTDGDARLPADLLAGLSGPLTVVLEVAMTAQYPAIPALTRAA